MSGEPRRPSRVPELLASCLGVALAYLVAGKAGLALAFVQANASPLWPAAGIALAALVAGGTRLWPGVFLGSFAANLLTPGTPAAAAALIAAGSTAAAIAGAVLVGRRGKFDAALRSWPDLLGLAVFGTLVGPLVSASNGTLQIWTWGMAPRAALPEIWFIWFAGDAAGTLLVAPLALVWWGRRAKIRVVLPSLEAIVLGAGATLTAALVFFLPVSASPLAPGAAFLVFPFGAWAALRLGLRGTTLFSLTVAILAVAGTLRHTGPFAAAAEEGELLLLQLFVVALALSSLLLAGLMEERLRFLLALEAEVRSRRATEVELAAARDRAEEADRIKSAFLAAMSHELRTPLNTIIGFTGLLQQGLPGPLNSEQWRQLGMVRVAAENLLAKINDILDVSQLSTGDLTITRAPFDVGEAVSLCVRALAPEAEKKGLRLTCEVSPEVGQVLSDRRRVEQIVRSLVQNSVKFTEEGGVAVSCRREGETVVTTVADTGIGISEESSQELFQAFRQLDSGLARRFEGAGVGLAIVKGLTELLGGEIRVSSEPGRGAAFAFVLPVGAGRSG